LTSHSFSGSLIRTGYGAAIFGGVYDHLGRSAGSFSYCVSVLEEVAEKCCIELRDEPTHWQLGRGRLAIAWSDRLAGLEAIVPLSLLYLVLRSINPMSSHLTLKL
jgi:hypothetical protein